jgi:hypothetical protein
MRRLVMIPTDQNVGYQKWLVVESVLRQLGGEEDQITFDNKVWTLSTSPNLNQGVFFCQGAPCKDRV